MMKSPISQASLSIAAVALAYVCWGGLSASRLPVEPPAEIEITARDLSGSQRFVEEALPAAPALPQAQYFALKVTQDLMNPAPGSQPRRVRFNPLTGVMAMVLRGMMVAASGAVPAWAQAYPAQPGLDVSWSLQGMADEEEQGGEGDIIEYGG